MIRHALFVAVATASVALAAPKPVFNSGLVTGERPVVDVAADLAGAEVLALVVNDGGDGFGCDWADWIDPVLTGPQGDVKLTTLAWKSATAGHGSVQVDKNVVGNPMRVGEATVTGLGTHANSIITYDIAGRGFTKLRARAGLDRAGTDQGCGSRVMFQVYALKAGDPLPVFEAGRPGSGGSQTPEDSLASMEIADGLEVSLWAAEPMLSNPTDIDIDARGRVWVCEGVNYRRWSGNRSEGDRIMILEDTDLDGRADKETVFYQGNEINSALGICVLGNKAIVSCSPNVFVFTDDNGDGKADRKEVVFSGIKGVQHDHGMHTFVFGPDGRLYFNMGNAGEQLLTSDGKPVIDVAGNTVNAGGNPYRQGLVFRCEPDFSRVDTLAWNFRNNYEVCVDSFGTLWQSDNDDDGNKGVRINYVMEYGNYGYSDEMTGAGWQQARPNIEADIPSRHWHQNDPGTVPNLLQTGSGSPTGILPYEGNLLPPVFRGQLIHCEPGHRVTRSYPVKPAGAGYTADVVNIASAADNWFRPSDVCVMPDGSLIVADWYDPGVGGHAMGDNQPGQTKGRLYRIAPKGSKPVVPAVDVATAEGAARALCSPNLATRYLGWSKLRLLGDDALPVLIKLWKNDDPRLRARALWLLGRIRDQQDKWIKTALADRDPDLVITGLRLARQVATNVEPCVELVVRHPSAQVRREAAIALRHSRDARAPGLWATLAAQHNGADRWYLEALGIGADGNETKYLAAWLALPGTDPKSTAGRDIVWRSRGEQTPGLLADLALDAATPTNELLRFVRAFDFQKASPAKDAALVRLLESPSLAGEALARLSTQGAQGHAEALSRTLDKLKGTPEFVALVAKLNVKNREADLFDMALGRNGTSPDGTIAAARALIAAGQVQRLGDALRGDTAVAAANALGLANDLRALPLLEPLVTAAQTEAPLRSAAVSAMARIEKGANRLLDLAKAGGLPAEARSGALGLLVSAPWEDVKERAMKLAPELVPAQPKLPRIAYLLRKPGDAARGQAVFLGVCSMCHQVNGVGVNYGPALSEIGSKFGKDALYDALLNPSAGISFGFETLHLTWKSGDTATGLLVSETRDEIALKSIGGTITRYSKTGLTGREKLKTSSMTEIARTLPPETLADLVEYLSTLKRN